MSLISSLSSVGGAESALGSGMALIGSASAQLNQDAVQIADPSTPDLTAPLLDLGQSKIMAETGAAVVRAADQMLGSILDVFA
jgi:hypothetical protein